MIHKIPPINCFFSFFVVMNQALVTTGNFTRFNEECWMRIARFAEILLKIKRFDVHIHYIAQVCSLHFN